MIRRRHDNIPTRPDLDNEIRVLLAKSNEKAQREQAERREVDAFVVAVISRLDEVERHRQLLDERTNALEGRMTHVEHVNVEQARTMLSCRTRLRISRSKYSRTANQREHVPGNYLCSRF